jgi:hypothetical protein
MSLAFRYTLLVFLSLGLAGLGAATALSNAPDGSGRIYRAIGGAIPGLLIAIIGVWWLRRGNRESASTRQCQGKPQSGPAGRWGKPNSEKNE